MNKFILIFINLILFTSIESARILLVHPSPSKSHLIVSKALMKELASRGHDVTVISSFPLDKPMKNYRDIYVPLQESIDHITNGFMDGSLTIFSAFKMLSLITTNITNTTINDPQVKKLMKEETFDLAIFGYFISDFQFGLSHHFNCPSIILIPAGTMRISNQFIGNPNEVSAVPHLLLGYKKPMTFLQRVANLLANAGEYAAIKFATGLQSEYYESNFPADKYPSYDQVIRNISLILANDHFSQGFIRPNLPNLIEVGGLQVKSKPSPLPENIQTFLDGAEHGAIFFSLGSNLKSSLLSKDKLDAIVKTFAKLKQRVVFKWDAEVLPGHTDNILIGKWLPQDDILSHKNVILFVSHGGLGSVVESKYHGVPIVGLPVFADQETNIRKVEAEGWGRFIDFQKMSEEIFYATIQDVLVNSNYKEKAEELSKLYRDRPQSAMETAVFWVEYVVRHKGAYHMRYQGTDLNILQAASIDVILFLSIILYSIIKIIKIICKSIAAAFSSDNSKIKTQ